ncbi:heterokaryon incompatibility protein-domain-containing protein, partial [Lasiosphaeria miniovina]
MRLLNTKTLELEPFSDTRASAVSYAILSHTWDDDEVTFDDMRDPPAAAAKAGFAKISASCEKAIELGLNYVWSDTCCIDKSSSAELSEAINSMFRWYKEAEVCFAFLSDLPAGSDVFADPLSFTACKWFSRGWTLQELIAPMNLTFFDGEWNAVGTKIELQEAVTLATRIPQGILDGSISLSSIPLAARMSWAANRDTTRPEDKAYCLLGIFGVNMSMIYGEGPKAFQRLQEEILRKTTDLSIFAWKATERLVGFDRFRGILAQSPSEFADCGDIELLNSQFRFRDEISLTNKGVKISMPLHNFGQGRFLMNLDCQRPVKNRPPTSVGIYLK